MRRMLRPIRLATVGTCLLLVLGVVAAPSVAVAVAGVVLGRGQDPVGLVELAGPSALEPVDGRLHLDDQPRVLAEALVGPAPAQVTGHAHTGAKTHCGP